MPLASGAPTGHPAGVAETARATPLPSGDVHLPPGAAFDPSADGAGTLPASWLRHWRVDPARPQLFDPRHGWATRGDLDRLSAEAAARLHAHGLRPGDRVLLSASASRELVVAHAASLRLGAVVVPTNTAYRADEVAHVVGDCRPRLAIAEDPELAGWIARADPSVRTLEPAVPGEAAAAPPLDVAAPQDAALIGYTSGTTGRPKGAVLSHRNLLASAGGRCASPGAGCPRTGWCWRCRSSTCTGSGWGCTAPCTREPLPCSCRVSSPRACSTRPPPTGRRCSSACRPCTTVSWRIRARASWPRCGCAFPARLPSPLFLHGRFEEATGQRVLERYGMTETAMLVSNPHDGERRPGTVGFPLPGVEARLAPGTGEIEVRGPNVFAGYWERPDADREAFTADGWFRTGDLGSLDADGTLRIDGRAKELIISGGFNVYPREVEDAVAAHPAVVEVAVVGEPSEEWGERVAAYVVARDPIALEALQAAVRERLAPYKVPRVLHPVEALPRNALGKVQKHRLAGGRVLDAESEA